VVLSFKFIPKLREKQYSKSWLVVKPPYGMIGPGESTVVKLSVLINNRWAHEFNFGHEKLEDILIMHLQEGKDYYITISGNYLASSFGSSLEYLVSFVTPIRLVGRCSTPASKSERLSIPKELWHIVNHIYLHGLDEEGLFLQSGIQPEMEQIREILDTGGSFDEYKGSIHSMAESLLRFLESLVEPVISVALYKQCLDNSHSYLQCKQILSFLPAVNYNVFYYIMAFLREVLLHSKKNKLTTEKAALLFSSVLLRSPAGNKVRLVNENVRSKRAAFISHFLTADEPLKVP